jgi:hypothetical protein
MLQLLTRLRLTTALTGTLLFTGCSQASPDTSAGSSPLAATSTPGPTKRSMGTPADSLNGMQGHTFGEPLSSFTNLVPVKIKLADGVRQYERPPGKESGWFGKHQQAVKATYQFQDGRFAAFQAIARAGNQAVLREQALYLLGPGQPILNDMQWHGERVGASFTVRGFGTDQFSLLQVWSKPLMDEQAAAIKARLQAENASATR